MSNSIPGFPRVAVNEAKVARRIRAAIDAAMSRGVNPHATAASGAGQPFAESRLTTEDVIAIATIAAIAAVCSALNSDEGETR